MAATDQGLRGTLGLATIMPQATGIIVGLVVCLAIALVLAGVGIFPAVLVLLGVCTALLAVIRPYIALVAAVAQFAFIPCEGTMLGVYIPNVLQFLCPLLFLSVLVRALKDFAHDRLAPRLTDALIAGFGLWGFIGLFLAVGGGRWKWYSNRMLLPIAFYFIVRLMWLKREHIVRLLGVTLASVGVQAVLMFRESWAGSSPVYPVQEGLVQGVKAATGPFPFHWSAAAFLAAWPPFCVYMIANARKKTGKVLWGLALLAILAANTRTMERSGIAASVLAIAVCLLSSRLRRTAGITLALLALLYIPWSMGSAGGALLDRFDQTDESRFAYRSAAIDLMKSSKWNPVYGVGWSNYGSYSGSVGKSTEVTAWGTRTASIAEIARGSKLHNVWLAIPVEFGLVGAVLALGIILVFVARAIAIWRRAREGPVDTGLLVAIIASLVAVSAVGYYQNIYHYAASMSLVWLLYGIIASKPQAFDLQPEDTALADGGDTEAPVQLEDHGQH